MGFLFEKKITELNKLEYEITNELEFGSNIDNEYWGFVLDRISVRKLILQLMYSHKDLCIRHLELVMNNGHKIENSVETVEKPEGKKLFFLAHSSLSRQLQRKSCESPLGKYEETISDVETFTYSDHADLIEVDQDLLKIRLLRSQITYDVVKSLYCGKNFSKYLLNGNKTYPLTLSEPRVTLRTHPTLQ